MKATIESNFNFNFYSIRIFAEILNAITTSKNEAELRKEMKRIKDSFLMSFSSYFDYGFWLKPHVGVRSRKKGKINIRGVLIELLGLHV